jgi:phage FluMu gp28-like protein
MSEEAVTPNLPDLLLPYQIEAIEQSHANALSVHEKSRRTGLTYAFAPDSVTTAAAAKGGMDVFYIAYNLDMTREFIGYCAEFTKAFDIVAQTNEFLYNDGSEQGIKAFRIDFPSGNSIVALSSKPRSLRGKQGVVIIDEAAFHEQLEELLKAAMALLMWGGRVIVISTHDGADNPFNELVEEIRSGKRKGAVQRLTLESALDQGLYKRICLRTGKIWTEKAEAVWEADLRSFYGDAAEEELDVVPARGSGTYLARATIEAAMSPVYPVVRLSCPNGFERNDLEWRTDWVAEWLETEIAPLLKNLDMARYCYFGQDFARSSDLSAIAIGQYDELANLVCHFIIEMRNVPFREQEQVLDFVITGMPLFAAGKMDARGNGQQLAETMQDKYGEDAIEGVMATPKTYLEMMPRLKARIEDRTIVMPRSEGVIDDLRCIKLVKGIPSIVDRTRDKADGSKGKRHGDTAIALMHLVAAADEDTGPIEFYRGAERGSPEIAGQFETTEHGSVRATYNDAFSL